MRLRGGLADGSSCTWVLAAARPDPVELVDLVHALPDLLRRDVDAHLVVVAPTAGPGRPRSASP
jgi:hypothetical protein